MGGAASHIRIMQVSMTRPTSPPPPQGCSMWGSGGDLTIQNVHAPTLGTKLNCQISAVFSLADIPSFSFMLHSERLVSAFSLVINYAQRANAHAHAMTSNAPPPGCYSRSNLPATPRYGTYWGAWGLFLIPALVQQV